MRSEGSQSSPLPLLGWTAIERHPGTPLSETLYLARRLTTSPTERPQQVVGHIRCNLIAHRPFPVEICR